MRDRGTGPAPAPGRPRRPGRWAKRGLLAGNGAAEGTKEGDIQNLALDALDASEDWFFSDGIDSRSGEGTVMARSPRTDLIDATQVGVYHCVQRAVRRAWPCGEDPVTGKNFDHRKVWIQERLAFLAGQFAIHICSMAIMSNHIHLEPQ